MTQQTVIFSHPDCALHDPLPQRGLAPARMELVLGALHAPGFEDLGWVSAPPASRQDLGRVHIEAHIDAVLAPIPPGADKAFDFETFATDQTARAVLQASGLALGAVAAVATGAARNAFCVVSPGGHHAEADCALGFCFFNHIGLAAIKAQQDLGMQRVAVLDFDAHHGNGTQSLFWNFEDRLYISLHEDNPLSGFADERGAWDNVLNLPLPHGSDGAAFRAALEDFALPKITAFRPDILLVSAGFDMHADDPLAGLRLGVQDYGQLGARLAGLADTLCAGRLVAVLEGGYDLNALGPSVAAFVKGMMKHD